MPPVSPARPVHVPAVQLGGGVSFMTPCEHAVIPVVMPPSADPLPRAEAGRATVQAFHRQPADGRRDRFLPGSPPCSTPESTCSVQVTARHADPSTTMRYGRARKNLDRHPRYILAAYLTSGTSTVVPNLGRPEVRLDRTDRGEVPRGHRVPRSHPEPRSHPARSAPHPPASHLVSSSLRSCIR